MDRSGFQAEGVQPSKAGSDADFDKASLGDTPAPATLDQAAREIMAIPYSNRIIEGGRRWPTSALQNSSNDLELFIPGYSIEIFGAELIGGDRRLSINDIRGWVEVSASVDDVRALHFPARAEIQVAKNGLELAKITCLSIRLTARKES